MSEHIIVPNVGKVEVAQFKYNNGRVGFVARTPDMVKEMEFFSLTVNIESIAPSLAILKEYDEAQLINKYLMEHTEIFEVIKTQDLGFNKIHLCVLKKKNWAKK